MRLTQLSEWEFKGQPPGDGFPQYFIPKDEWRPAHIPSHIHTDLMAHGIIADPFLGQAELGCQWVDRVPWSYRTSFEWQPDGDLPKRILRFEGLDTVCEVFLNDQPIAGHDNMFVPLEIDVTARLREGGNELRVDFQPATLVGLERRKVYFHQHGLKWQTGFFDERAFVRKAQYMSGWDWGPRLVSCGIWQPVSLLEYAGRLVDFQVLFEHLDGGAYRVWSESTTEGIGNLTTEFDGDTYEGDFDLVMVAPELWWPAGYGEQPLYTASARFESDKASKKIGLREVRLVREADEYGESFEFEVNQKRIWARGANWIPNDSFPSRIQGHEIEDQIAQALDLNFNMLRVWGGGLYESEAFYQACDEKGILVWQDFPYACSYYPDDEDSVRKTRQEATLQVKRLRHHPSLAIWCGNNENLAMHEQGWAQDNKPSRYIGQRIFTETLPAILKELDPQRPYISSSPTGPASGGGKCNDGGAGDQHFWDVWHGRGDWKYYSDSTARFASEFGFAGSCSLEAWDEVLKGERWDSQQQTVAWHNKTGKPLETWLSMVRLHYPEPRTLEDWTYFSRLNQRDALRFAIEHYRTSEFCQGALIWQFNDCWPVQSWSVQDYARVLKPAGWELKRLYAPILLAVKQTKGRLQVWAANDGSERRTLECEFTLFTPFCSRCQSLPADLGPGERKKIGAISLKGIEPQTGLYVARVPGEPILDRWGLLDEPKNLRMHPPKIAYAIHGNELRLTLTGVAFDPFVYDPDDPANLRAVGQEAQAVMNGELCFEFERKPARVSFRCLTGTQEVVLS